jgi:hypothetical protein
MSRRLLIHGKSAKEMVQYGERGGKPILLAVPANYTGRGSRKGPHPILTKWRNEQGIQPRGLRTK